MKQMSIPPQELDILSYLQHRMKLSVTLRNNHNSLSKGMVGEQRLYRLFKDQLPPCFLIVPDLLLAQDGTEFQIDLLLVGEHTIYVLEVKNYDGNFVIQDGNWHVASSRNEIRNPLHQLKRMDILLRNLLKRWTINFSVESYVVFVHPEFYLYEAPLESPLIFPTQINRFLRQLQSSPFNQTGRHKGIVRFLQGQRLERSSHERLPEYCYEELKKGIVCRSCSRFLAYLNYTKLVCHNCKQEEPLECAVKRNIIEFNTLFPNRKITTSAIIDWCHIIKSRKTIRRILKTHLITNGTGRYTYYSILE